jgi:hypothetical protein
VQESSGMGATLAALAVRSQARGKALRYLSRNGYRWMVIS